MIQLFNIPIHWVFGSKPEIEELVESGRITPGRAIDLGCGAGIESIYLSKHGFDVTGIDLSPTAIKLARKRAQTEGAKVEFIRDDLTDLRNVRGTFDFLLDFGALNDLNRKDRDLYVLNVLPLSHPGSQYLLMCFDNRLPYDEVELRFSEKFDIDMLTNKTETYFGHTIVLYLLIRT